MMYYDRDKELTKEILEKHKVPVPKTIKSRSLKKIKEIIKKNKIKYRPRNKNNKNKENK